SAPGYTRPASACEPCSKPTSHLERLQRSLLTNVSLMPKTEDDPLGPGFVRRLRGELDSIRPRSSSPRYLTQGGPVRLRIAPAVLAVSLVAILALSLFAATGSPNPVVGRAPEVTGRPRSPPD